MKTNFFIKKSISVALHLFVFIIIEILFVFIILHEFPSIKIFEVIGIIHLTYWLMILVAGLIRQRLQKYRSKFLATYLPIVFHILGHIYVLLQTVHSIETNTSTHDDHNIIWIIISTIAVGIIIFIGEWLIHKTTHCDSHHIHVHKHCKE